MFTSLLAAMTLVSGSLAQTNYYPTTHTVTVGPNGLIKYEPEYIVANAGDIVEIVFETKNHTFTQSSFATPCSPLNTNGVAGFDSGFMPIDAAGDAQTIFLEVTDTTTPLWFYCRQTNHCAVNGMVFAINPPPTGNHSFVNFLANAVANGTVANIPASLTQTGLPPTTLSTVAAATATAPPVLTASAVTETVTASNGTVWTSTYASYSGQAAPTQNPTPQVHNVVVGPNGELAYSPSNITAAINDIIQFEFQPKNHTVTQSTFAEPCIKIGSTTGKDGFDSGFMPVDSTNPVPSFFNVTVTSMAPIWVYCRQHTPTGASHCGEGMVFSVNAIENGPNNFDAFKSNALRINGTVATPQSSSNGGGGSGTSPSPSPSASPKGGAAGLTTSRNGIVATTGLALALAASMLVLA